MNTNIVLQQIEQVARPMLAFKKYLKIFFIYFFKIRLFAWGATYLYKQLKNIKMKKKFEITVVSNGEEKQIANY
jgi:hypothetical protein